METVTDRIRRLGRESAVPSAGGVGVGQVDEREQAILDRHTSEAPKISFLQKAARGAAEIELETRRKQREYAEKPQSTLAAITVDPAREMVANLGDRAKVLDTIRKLSPEQRQEALKLAPGIAQQLGDDRGGVVGRTLGAVSRGISHMVTQPIAEMVGLGGTPEEIEYIRQLDAAASQEFSPARPGDPWYERGPLQALEMAPWMATVVGGNVAGSAIAKTGGQVLARGASAGVPGAKGVFQGIGAVGKIPKVIGLKGATTKATMEGAGGLAGITAAAFPSQYAQEVDQLKEIGMEDNLTMRLLAGGTAAIAGLIEGIVPNPFKAGNVPWTEGAIKAARQYLWNAAKQAPGEMSEEYLQGVTSGLGEHVAQYLDDNAQEKSIADAFKTGWEQAKEAALPMAFLLGVPAVGGAGLSAVRAQRLQQALAKGFVSEDDAKQLGIQGKNRKERGANAKSELEQLSAVPPAPEGAQPGVPQYKGPFDFGTGEPEGDIPPPPGLGLLDRLRGLSTQETQPPVPPPALPQVPPPLPKIKGPKDASQVPTNEDVQGREQGKQKPRVEGEREAGNQGGQAAQGDAATEVQVAKPWELTEQEIAEDKRLTELIMSGKKPTAEDQAMVDALTAKSNRRFSATAEEAASMSDKDYSKWEKPRFADRITREDELRAMVEIRAAQDLRPDTPKDRRKLVDDAIQNSRQQEDPDAIRKRFRALDDAWTEDDVLRRVEDAKEFNKLWDEIAAPKPAPATEVAKPPVTPAPQQKEAPSTAGSSEGTTVSPTVSPDAPATPETSMGKAEGENQSSEASGTGARKMQPTEEGRPVDGKPIMPGDRFLTNTGRETTPYPKGDSSTERKAINAEKKSLQWLMENALAEAESRGDEFNARTFRSELEEARKGKLPQASKDSATLYVFGDYIPKVPKPFLKPAGAAAQPESKWQSETRAKLEAVPALKGAKVEPDENAGTVKVTRPDGLSTTIHFNADEELAKAAKAKLRNPESIHGWYVREPGAKEGKIYLRSDANHTNILNHEVMHWLEDAGVVTKEEVEQYGGREAIAEKYGKWAELKQRKKDSVFQRIYDALEPVFSSQRRFFEEVGKRAKPQESLSQDKKPSVPQPPAGYQPLAEFTPMVSQVLSPDLEMRENIDDMKQLKLEKGDVVGYRVYPKRGSIKGGYWQYGTVTNVTGSHAGVKREDGTEELVGGSRLRLLKPEEDPPRKFGSQFSMPMTGDPFEDRVWRIAQKDGDDSAKNGLFYAEKEEDAGRYSRKTGVNVINGDIVRLENPIVGYTKEDVLEELGIKPYSLDEPSDDQDVDYYIDIAIRDEAMASGYDGAIYLSSMWGNGEVHVFEPSSELKTGEQVGNKPETRDAEIVPEFSPIGEKPEVGGEADFDAEMEKLMAGLTEPESGLTKPPSSGKKPRKPRSVKKQPTTTPEEKSADDRARAAAKKEEAKRKMREAFEGTQNRPLSGFDPEIGIKVAQAAKLYIEAGALDFRAFIRDLVADFGKTWVEDKSPYFESAWRTANKLKWVDSPAGTVADVLGEVQDENDTGSARDSRGTADARPEDLGESETEVGEVTDAGRPENTGDGGGRGLAGDGGRTEVEGTEPSGGTERGDEDVRLAAGPGGNYRIGDDERVGSGAGRGFSAKARFAENVKAIRLLKKLEKEGRKATAEEQSVLVKYVGWGGLKQAFGRGKLVGGKTVYQPIKGYESEFTELKDLLTSEEWNSAKKSITNAHYTDPAVISGMWQGLKALGFKGGKIVEPSSGTGLFFGLIPQSILDNPSTRLAATEIDSVSGRIAQQLYQGADIRVHGFEELNLTDNSVDLFISNVPFGQNQLSDKQDRSIKKGPIHNFFFNKAIKKTRPGGLVAFITSRFSMDEKDASTREFWDKSGADLVGVVRLPGGAFKGIANTDVVTDIIILQKREDGADPAHAAPWKKRKNVPQTGYLELVRRKDGPGRIKVRNEGDTAFPVNEYFEAHPEHVVGELAWTGTMQKTDENQVNVESPETGTIGDRVNEIIGGLPVNKERLDRVATMTEEIDNADMEAIKSGEWKEDHLRVEGDRIYLNHFGTRVEVPVPYGRHKKDKDGEIVEIVSNKKGAERTTAIIKVFNAAERLIALQPTDATDEQIEVARQELNTVYDAAVKKFGPLSSGWNATFSRMSLTVASRVFSLEEYDPTTDTAQKAAVFTERTERPHTFPTTADNAQDALTISLSQVGRLDPSHAANLLGKPVDTTMEELGDLVFKNNSGEWELASTYLSGNVRQKLAEARKLAEDNGDYLRNVEALEAVQPADLNPSQIEVRLNSPWIPTEVFEQFLDHLLRRNVKVSHSQSAGKWFLTPENRNRNDQLETLDWGIARMPALEIITKSLNRGDLRVWEPDGHGGRVVNRDDTTQVAAKLTKIKAEFERWIWDSPERVDLLTGIYNREINNIHQEPRDGSHLTFPGMSEDVRAKLDAHQVNAVWRYLTGGNMLLAHVVGAGKSWVMAASAMEQKRISGNPSYKTMIAVPNHLVTSGQFVKEIYEAYPSAKVLAATPDSLSGIGRRSLLKKMATGNYDIVVIAHSSFGKIPLNPTHEADFIQKQIDDLEAEVRTARADSDRSYEAELQTMIDNLRDKLSDMSAALQRDELSTYFDELNIDSLFVDEAHEFKNLAFRTRMSRVPGVNPTGSNMAFDMWMKTTYFNQATNEKNLMFATGTPIANAIAEMYTMQRYLQPSELARLGLEHFDSWAASFADEVTKPEIDPAGGGMRMHSRLSQYINMPELSAIFRQIADVQTADMLVDVLKRPLIEGDAPQAIKAERNAILEEIIEGLQERAQRVRSGAVDKSEDNMLNIVTDGRKAATDIRLIDPSYPDLKGSKVNLAVENIHRIWQETSDKKSTQVVWLDVTSPNTDYPFNLYHEIVDKLAALGIPRDEIAIMHDYNEKTKAQLFRSMNKGDIRVLLGSTAVMGTGVNVQRKLIASHHLDVPWRPDQLEQRDGRILRRGNTNKRVKIIRYISKGSFDSFMWDKIEQKSSFIRAAMSGASDRVLDASEAEDMSAAEMKAAAADDPNLIRFVTVQAEVNKLESEHRGFLDQQSQIRRGIAEARNNVERYSKYADDFEALVARQESIDIPEGEVRGKIGDVEFTDPKEFGEALTTALINAPATSKGRGDTVRFEYNGLNGSVSQWVDGSRSTGRFGSQDTYIDLDLAYSATGNVTRLNNAIAKLKEQPKYYRDNVEREQLKIPALEKRIQAGWPDANKLSELRQEHATLAGLVQASGSDEHKQEVAGRINLMTGRAVIVSGETGRYLWKDVKVTTNSAQNASQNEAAAVVPANIVDAAEGQLTAERNRDREARLRKLRDEAEVYEWDRTVSPRPPKKKPARKKAADASGGGESRSLDAFTSPELQDRQSMGAARTIIASAADLVGDDVGGSGSKYASPDKEFERRWQMATRGISKKTLATKLREFWQELVKSTVRGSLPELPRTEQFGEARSAMHAYQNAPVYAQLAAADLLKKTTKPLSASDYDLFTRVVVARDQVEAANKKERLSFGWSPARAKAELDRVEALAASNERVQASLEYRKQWMEAMVNDFLSAHEYLGLDMTDRFKRENYFRHQVLYYMEAQQRGLGKKKVELTPNRGWLKGRTSGDDLGEAFDINANYLQAEWEVSTQMIADTKRAQAIGRLKRHYDKMQKLKEEAKYNNYVAVVGGKENMAEIEALRDEIAAGGLDSDELKELRARLWELDPTMPFRQQMAIAADQIEGGAKGLGEDVPSDFLRYVAALAKQDDSPLQGPALSFLKALSDRKAFIKNVLGDQYQTWEDVVPDDHEEVAIRPGRAMFQAYSVPEQVASELMADLSKTLGISAEDLRPLTALGSKYTPLVVPQEVAAQMAAIDNLMDFGWLDRMVTRPMRAWKRWVLMSPTRVFKYNLRNLSEVDKVIALNPAALKDIPQAIRDLWKLYSGADDIPATVRDWVERGGSGTLVRVNELGELNELKQFAKLIADKRSGVVGKVIKAPANAWKAYWSAAGISSDFRESILRYAAYLNYLKQLDAGKLTNYGGSVRAEVDGIKDNKDKAMRLSADLLGDYGDISLVGQFLRSRVAPFWSFQETNLRTYFRGLVNLASNEQSAIKAGMQIARAAGIGGLAKTPFLAYKLGRIAILFYGLKAMTTAFNQLLFADDDDELSEEEKRKAHLTFGKNSKGEVQYFSRIGTAADVLDWVGLDSVDYDLRDVLDGRRTLRDVLNDMARSPVDKAYGMLSPFIKTPTELAVGQTAYPSVGKPRPIRDRGRYIAQNLGLQKEYDKLTGKPSTPYSVTDLFLYKVEPGTSAYYLTLDAKFRWLKTARNRGVGYSDSSRGNALRNYKMAVRLKDQTAADKYLAEYEADEGTKDGLLDSLEWSHPAGGLSTIDAYLFYKSLAPVEQAEYRDAERFYYSELLTEEQAKTIRTRRDKRLSDLAVGKNKDGSPKGKPVKQSDETQATYQERLREWAANREIALEALKTLESE